LIRRNGKKTSIESLLKIAAIGTVADVAPLIGENRTIAWLGLNGLADPRNRGLRTLIRRLGMLGRPLRAVDVGFKIGPRINAAGRLSSAETAIDLFSAPNDDVAWELCSELDRMNAERQAVEEEVRVAAEKQVMSSRIVIVAGEGWHRGVIGLTAGRLAQKYHRPTLAIAIDGDHCVGSGRSISTINLHHQLEAVADLFTHFGGHEFACGFALERRNLDALRERLTAQFEALDRDLFRREARVESKLVLGEIDSEFVAAHEMLQPFGAGNPQPLFAVSGVEILSVRTFAPDCMELMIADATGRASAVLWPSAKALAEELRQGMRTDVLVQIEPNGYVESGARLNIVDARRD
jgi:single-stranded-DNA-specific exonuclease